MSPGASSLATDQRGFSLVELLVVMLIIGLLAAIAIPSFFNQRGKAQDAAAKTAVRSAETALATYATDNDGSYAGVTPGDLRGIEPTLTAAALSVDLATGSSYRLTVTSVTGNSFSIERQPGGARSLTCDPPATGGCPVGGIWG